QIAVVVLGTIAVLSSPRRGSGTRSTRTSSRSCHTTAFMGCVSRRLVLALDGLVESRDLACRGAFLVHQLEVGLVELAEELVPGDLLELLLPAVAGKIEAQDSRIAAASGALHAGRPRVPFFRPFADRVVSAVRRVLCCCAIAATPFRVRKAGVQVACHGRCGGNSPRCDQRLNDLQRRRKNCRDRQAPCDRADTSSNRRRKLPPRTRATSGSGRPRWSSAAASSGKSA